MPANGRWDLIRRLKIIGCIDMDGAHSPVVNRLKTSGILLADEMALARETGRSLVQRSPIARECACMCVSVLVRSDAQIVFCIYNGQDKRSEQAGRII